VELRRELNGNAAVQTGRSHSPEAIGLEKGAKRTMFSLRGSTNPSDREFTACKTGVR
jgi:hypothetical protein